MKRIYIAGPMSGLPDLNFPAFHREAARLRTDGFDVVNPAEINGGAAELVAMSDMNEQQMADHWRACMRNDIAHLVTCDAIVMLPGWERSRVATLEHHIAKALGIAVVCLEREAVAG